MGVEITGKVLGLIGCGNIGSIAAERAIGLKMKVIAYDPFLSQERATALGVEKAELDDVFARADFITLHVPLNDKTRNIIDAAAITKMKDGVRIINCARGGLVVEKDLAEALESGKVAGAAFDVFEVEPAKDSPLFNLPNVVCTPHLGASTSEAQENVAVQVAQQMSAYLVDGAVSNAINMPSITAEEAPILAPFVKLAGHLGSFVGQVTEGPIKKVEIIYDGAVSKLNTEALTSATLAGLIRPQVSDVNMVSAPVMVKERGIQVSETRQDKSGVYESYMKLVVTTDTQQRSIAGTVFSDGKPRFIQIKGINMDADVGRHMLYTTNHDEPGIIGTLGNTLGQAGANIANFHLGRNEPGGDAIALLYLDTPTDSQTIEALLATGKFQQVKVLEFEVE